MKIVTEPKFLTTGSKQLTGRYRALAIHPSSEVDLVDIDGVRLGVGGIVPFPLSGANVLSVRNAPNEIVAASGDHLDVGQKLVLQLYEDCDELVPPAPRHATFRSGIIAASALGAVVAAANLIVRLPFQGRAQAAIRFKRLTSPQDLSLVVLGVSYGTRSDAGTGANYVELPVETWWNGGGAAPTVTTGPLALQLQAAVVNLGGMGDEAEALDELQCWVYGPAGLGRAECTAVAFGELRR